MSKNTSKTPNLKKGKTLARRRLLDLASSLSGPPSTCTSGSVDLFSEVDPEVSTAPNSTSPSSADDDSVATLIKMPEYWIMMKMKIWMLTVKTLKKFLHWLKL